MLHKLIKFVPILVIGFLLLFQPSESRAETLNRALFLDEVTMQRGYTVPSKHYDFLVGIRGGIFNQSAWVKIKEASTEEISIPEDKELISAVFSYDIQVSDPQVLEEPIFISLKFDSDTPHKKRIHFWNRLINQWQEIPTEIDFTNNIAKAAIHFPWSLVAVFEDPAMLDEPVKVADSTSLALQSEAAIAIDSRSGKVLYSKDPEQVWWLASLTKLMTALVFLETNPNFDRVITYTSADDTIGGRLKVYEDETMTIQDLFYSMLVGSANNAANALQRSTGLSREEFVSQMNIKAQELELSNTVFTDTSGLDLGNKSTVFDYARLTQLVSKDFRILQATTAPAYSFRTINTGKLHNIENTNKLLDSNYYFLTAKTGYLDEAHYNFAAKVRNEKGSEIITVIFGAASDWLRWNGTSKLIDWVNVNYRW